MFGRACLAENQAMVSTTLNVVCAGFEERYLGLPVPEGRMKNDRFQSLKDKYAKRLTDWLEKYMSAGAKEVLIKSVMQAIPLYTMGIFKFSAGLRKDLMQMIRNFWWGDEENARKVH